MPLNPLAPPFEPQRREVSSLPQRRLRLPEPTPMIILSALPATIIDATFQAQPANSIVAVPSHGDSNTLQSLLDTSSAAHDVSESPEIPDETPASINQLSTLINGPPALVNGPAVVISGPPAYINGPRTVNAQARSGDNAAVKDPRTTDWSWICCHSRDISDIDTRHKYLIEKFIETCPICSHNLCHNCHKHMVRVMELYLDRPISTYFPGPALVRR